jgi:hypothetical protein
MADKLRKAAQNILNGIETGAIKIETEQDETSANALSVLRAALAQSKGHVLLPVEDAEIILSGVAWGDDAATKRYFDAKDRLRVAMEGEKP